MEAAILKHLLLANLPDCPEIPQYFRDKHRAIIDRVTARTWGPGLEGDRVRATLHGKHGKTLSKLASEILELHDEFEEYLSTGFVPTTHP